MRDLSKLVGLSALIIILNMNFRPPKPAETLRAIGDTKKLPITLQRALDPGTVFAPIPAPKAGDWLAEHPEIGQTFDDFVKDRPNKPDARRNRIYIQPLGRFQKGKGPPLETLRTYAAAYLVMDVKVLPPVSVNDSKFRTRLNPISKRPQILTGDVLESLKGTLLDDAFCLLAITMEDLYPHPSWNFVFGQASARDHVGVFSFARYDPVFYGERPGKDYQEIFLRRSCKVLVHEVAHMFSLGHCIFFSCVLNGSNHLEESDARPLSLCPVCLRKLQFGVGFDVVDRYRKLLLFYQKAAFNHEAQWVSARLKTILGDDKGRLLSE
jgi:archaemetzincin